MKRIRALAAFVLSMAGVFACASSFGQSAPTPTITFGETWSASQWVSAWQSKADVNSPALTGSPTINGWLIPSFPQSTAEASAGVTPANSSYPWGNILRYGADPTGGTSSATALSNAAAANSVVTFPAGIFAIPCGTYYSFATAVSLIGAGEGITTLRFASGCAQTADFFKWNGLSDVTVQNLTIDLNTPATPASRQNVLGFYAYAASAAHLLVDRVEIKNAVSPVFLISVAAAGGFSYSDVRIQGSTLSLGIAATSQNQCIAFTTVNAAGTIPSPVISKNTCINSGIQVDGYGSLIDGNDVSGWKFGTGIFTAFDTSGAGPSSVDCIISNNRMHDSPSGVDVNNTAFGGLENNCVNALIVGNKAWNLGGAGYYNYGNGATYIANSAWDNGKNGTGGSGGVLDTAGFTVSKASSSTQANSNNVSYIANSAFDDGAGTQSYGYAEEAGGNVFSSTLRGNSFKGVTQGMVNSGSGSYDAGYVATQTAVATPVASLAFTGLDTASYKSWHLECRDITPVTATTLGIQVGEGATPTWETAGSYGLNSIYSAIGGGPSAASSNVGTSITLTPDNLDNAQAGPATLSVDMGDLAYPAGYKLMKWTMGYYKATVGLGQSSGLGAWMADTNSVTAIRLIAASGNVYGSCTLTGRP